VQGRGEKRRWRPFPYFVIISSVVIVAMWAGILFGGQLPPARTADFTQKPEFLLFMVDAAVKRYAHYRGNRYPERLSDLVPKYVPLRKDELFHLDKLSYRRDSEAGYYLLLGDAKAGEMTITLSPQGIAYGSRLNGGFK
jgi:hypothetical protein